jgi:hypothetical protein
MTLGMTRRRLTNAAIAVIVAVRSFGSLGMQASIPAEQDSRIGGDVMAMTQEPTVTVTATVQSHPARRVLIRLTNVGNEVVYWRSHDREGYYDVEMVVTDKNGDTPALTEFGERMLGVWERITHPRSIRRKLNPGEFHVWILDLDRCFVLHDDCRYFVKIAATIEHSNGELRTTVESATSFGGSASPK